MLFRCSSSGLVALAAICISISILIPISVKASGPGNVGAQSFQYTSSIWPDDKKHIVATAKDYFYRDELRKEGRKQSETNLMPLGPLDIEATRASAYKFSQEQSIRKLVKYNREMAARQGTPTGRGTQPAQDTAPCTAGEVHSLRKKATMYLFKEVKAWTGIEEPMPRTRPRKGDTFMLEHLKEARKNEQERIEKAKKEGTFKKPYPLKLPDVHRFVMQYVRSQPLPVLKAYLNRRNAQYWSGVTDKEHQTRETAENNHFNELKAKNGDVILDESELAKLGLEAHIYAQLQPRASLEAYNREVAARPTTSAGHIAQSTQGTAPGTAPGAAPGMSDERTTPTKSSEESTSRSEGIAVDAQ